MWWLIGIWKWLVLGAASGDGGGHDTGAVDDRTAGTGGEGEGAEGGDGGPAPGAGGAPPAAGVDVATAMADDIRKALVPKKDGAEEHGVPAKPAKAEVGPDGKPVPAKPDAAAKPTKKDDKYGAPDDVGPKGQARFRELVGELKTYQEAIAQKDTQLQAARDFLTDAESVGVGPQQFQDFFEFMDAVKRGDGQAALKILQGQMEFITKEFGLPAGPSDVSLIDRYPDLKEAVDSFNITKEHALELAQARAGADRRTRVDTAQQQATQAATAQQQAEDAGIDDVAKWFSATAKTDIDFVRKKPALLEQLPELVKGVAPKYWVAKVKAVYALMGQGPAAEKPVPGKPQPLRPNAGGGQPENVSMFDAIKSGLTSMAGRGR